MIQAEKLIIEKAIQEKNFVYIRYFVARYVLLCLDKRIFAVRNKGSNVSDYEGIFFIPQNRIWHIKRQLALYFTDFALYGMFLWVAKRKRLITQAEYKKLCEKEGYDDKNNRYIVKFVCDMKLLGNQHRWHLKDFISDG